jgi:hypothetical protein
MITYLTVDACPVCGASPCVETMKREPEAKHLIIRAHQILDWAKYQDLSRVPAEAFSEVTVICETLADIEDETRARREYKPEPVADKWCDQCGVYHAPPVSEGGFDGPDCPRYERMEREYGEGPPPPVFEPSPAPQPDWKQRLRRWINGC